MRRKISNLFIAQLSIIIMTICFSIFSLAALVQAQTTNNITLYGSASQGWGFTEQTITIPGPKISFQEGELYNITLISSDGLTHKFFIDYNNNGNADNDEPASPSFSSTIIYQFTPDRTGDFTYYCSIHPSTMYGNVSIIPEFSSFTLLVIITIMSVVVIAFKRELKKGR